MEVHSAFRVPLGSKCGEVDVMSSAELRTHRTIGRSDQLALANSIEFIAYISRGVSTVNIAAVSGDVTVPHCALSSKISSRISTTLSSCNCSEPHKTRFRLMLLQTQFHVSQANSIFNPADCTKQPKPQQLREGAVAVGLIAQETIFLWFS